MSKRKKFDGRQWCDGLSPEFGRWQDVERNFSIRRGTTYNLLRDGKIKGVLLRIRGKKSGLRLFDMQSVRDFIQQQQKGGTD